MLSTTDSRSDPSLAGRTQLEALPCFQLYLGWRRAQAFYRPLLEEGTNAQRMYVLALLTAHGELGVTEVARALDLDVASASGLLSRMAQEGLVTRRRPPQRAHTVRVRPTRKGRSRHQRVGAAIEAADRRLLAALRPGDLEALQRVVATLARLTEESAE